MLWLMGDQRKLTRRLILIGSAAAATAGAWGVTPAGAVTLSRRTDFATGTQLTVDPTEH